MKNEVKLNKLIVWKTISAILGILLLLSIFTDSFAINQTKSTTTKSAETATDNLNTATGNLDSTKKATFSQTEDELCTEDGKPLVVLFSTTWCPHCKWIKSTFEETVKEYGNSIKAYHWEIDINDNTLTSAVETVVPTELKALYSKYNPKGSIPTFVFGCKYVRIGNGYERQKDLDSEKAEFKEIIDELIA